MVLTVRRQSNPYLAKKHQRNLEFICCCHAVLGARRRVAGTRRTLSRRGSAEILFLLLSFFSSFFPSSFFRSLCFSTMSSALEIGDGAWAVLCRTGFIKCSAIVIVAVMRFDGLSPEAPSYFSSGSWRIFREGVSSSALRFRDLVLWRSLMET